MYEMVAWTIAVSLISLDYTMKFTSSPGAIGLTATRCI